MKLWGIEWFNIFKNTWVIYRIFRPISRFSGPNFRIWFLGVGLLGGYRSYKLPLSACQVVTFLPGIVHAPRLHARQSQVSSLHRARMARQRQVWSSQHTTRCHPRTTPGSARESALYLGVREVSSDCQRMQGMRSSHGRGMQQMAFVSYRWVSRPHNFFRAISFWYRIAKIRSGWKKVQDCWSRLNALQAACSSSLI